MVLSEALFEWVYDVAFPPHIQLCNIFGGTDMAGGISIENSITPVYSGGCHGPSLGMCVEVYNQEGGGRGVRGEVVPDGTPGEIVVTKSFPNQPVYFYEDPTGEKYFNAYYARYDDSWTHGDFVSIHPVTRQHMIYGRADGVLNPSGVRFGSAEIYNVIDQFFSSDVQDSICVGQRRPRDYDESVMLFLMMKPGKKFTEGLASAIKGRIGIELSKRHVPKYVFETPEIPVSRRLAIKVMKWWLTDRPDDDQLEEGRVASEAARVGTEHQAIRYTGKQGVLGVLQAVCRGREAARSDEQALVGASIKGIRIFVSMVYCRFGSMGLNRDRSIRPHHHLHHRLPHPRQPSRHLQ